MTAVYSVLVILVGNANSTEKNTATDPVPTYADAAIILAKFSGFFDGYVATDASMTECVAFLNRAGIYFGLMEVVNGSEFAVQDCARAMGQIELVLSGEAEYSAGKVKLPKAVASWEDFCIMNDVGYKESYQAMQEVLRKAGEIREKFFLQE